MTIDPKLLPKLAATALAADLHARADTIADGVRHQQPQAMVDSAAVLDAARRAVTQDPVTRSKRIGAAVGSGIALVATLLPLFGVQIDAGDVALISQHADSLIAALGAAVGLALSLWSKYSDPRPVRESDHG